MSVTQSRTVRIDDATFYSSEDHQFVWDANTDLDCTPGGGTDEGRLLIRLDVDGQMDIVYADVCGSGDLNAIDRAIAALEEVRSGLAQMYQGRNDPGRCMKIGDWGRCYGSHGHDDDHHFPSEQDWRSLRAPLREAVAS